MSVEHREFDDAGATYKPIFKRPPLPSTWSLLAPIDGLEEYDKALILLDGINADQSWHCEIDLRPSKDGSARYTVFVTQDINDQWIKLGRSFQRKLWKNDPMKLGVGPDLITPYVEELMQYWRDARTMRSEFVRWLNEGRIAYRLLPCNRSWGANDNLPFSDVLLSSRNDEMRVKLAGTLFSGRHY